MAADAEPSMHSRGKNILMAVFGIVVGTASWWVLDILIAEQSQKLNRAVSAVPMMLGIIVVAIVATGLLLLSRSALLAAAGVVILGIVLGGYGSGSALITLWNDDAHFVLLRGAHEPAIWTLGAVWLTIAVTNMITTGAISR